VRVSQQQLIDAEQAKSLARSQWTNAQNGFVVMVKKDGRLYELQRASDGKFLLRRK
jgi:hypothetical protein